MVRVIACLAEGLGIRGMARAFEISPNTGLNWEELLDALRRALPRATPLAILPAAPGSTHLWPIDIPQP